MKRSIYVIAGSLILTGVFMWIMHFTGRTLFPPAIAIVFGLGLIGFNRTIPEDKKC